MTIKENPMNREKVKIELTKSELYSICFSIAWAEGFIRGATGEDSRLGNLRDFRFKLQRLMSL